jgi:hypothetical protein
MIVGKAEMERGLLANICIVIFFPVHYSIDIQLLYLLYYYFELTSPNLNFHKTF